MIELNLSDQKSNFIADRINNFHSLLTIYVLFGWISTYHSKILTLFIPSLFMNWLIDDNECCINHIERYFRIEDKKFYINDNIICINKNNLNNDYNGKINRVSKGKITLKVYKYNITINIFSYYIFVKKNTSKNNTRQFYKSLLEKL